MPATPALLCIDDAAALRDRCAGATGLYRRYLDHFLWVARHAPELGDWQLQTLHVVPEGLVRPLVRPDETAYACLAYVLTGDLAFARLGRERLFALADSVAEREQGEWTQNHCWCDAFPFGRWMVYYDWLYDSGVFSAADHAHLTERFLYYLWAHPGQRLKARQLSGTPCNNQNAAMAFATAAGGYLFGVKRGHDPVAGRLLAQAMPHLVSFLTAFPRGGYSFEGSTYMGQVNAMALPLGLELVRSITGIDLLDSRQDDACASARETLQAVMRLAMPSGLCLPWDNYGYERANFTPAAAYLARRTGDDAGLAFLAGSGTVERPAHIAWGFDKTLWTLLFWPDRLVAGPRDFAFCHAEPSLGAGAAGPQRRLFAFQMWDRSHWPPGRAQYNPNNLILEFDGAPLLLDGRCIELPKDASHQHEKYHYFRPDTRSHASFGSGTVGAHNCLFFDNEEEYASHLGTEGRLVGADFQDGAALFAGDVTTGFAERYDVTAVQRAALVLDDELVVVRDRISAGSEHRVNWRVHLRAGNLRLHEHGATLISPERIRLDIVTPDGREFVHRQFADPHRATRKDGQLEGEIHELTTTVTGCEVDLVTVIAVAAGLEPWRELASGWEWAWAPDAAAAEVRRAAWTGGQPLDPADGSWFYRTDEHRPGCGVYRCRFTVDQPPTAAWLKLPRLVRGATVHVNDQPFAVELGWEQVPLLPHLLPLGDSLRPGENVIDIVVSSTLEAALQGQVQLLVPAPAQKPPTCQALGNTSWEITHCGLTWRIEWTDRVRIGVSDGRRFDLDPARPPDTSGASAAGPAPELAVQAALLAVNRDAPTLPRPAGELAAAILGDDWRAALLALEEARCQPAPATVEAAWQLLQREVETHESTFPRRPDDICWYRLKAAAIYLLGDACYQPAVPLLGKLLGGNDFYPVRVACVQALGAIGTPAARRFVEQVPEHDEHNTALAAKGAFKA